MDVTYTTCRLCLARCGMIVESEDGRVTRIVGDRDHPLSRGWLCVKGKWSLDYTLSRKRVLHPMRRVGERGDGRWERVTWDAALDDVAERLSAIIEESGPAAVAVQALPPKEYFAYDIFCEAIGSPTFFKHDSHQCFTPQLIADTLTFGNLLTYPAFLDVDESEVLVLWGINPHETNPSKDQRVRTARRNGSRTIVVDPRPTSAAKSADLWLRVRPGTDAALALGLLHVMIDNGWYDASFVAAWTEGFSALAERVARYPPGRVADITWIPERDIVRAAEMFGTAGTAALYTFIGATMGGNAVATLRLMGFLPALKGVDVIGNNRFLKPPRVRMPGYSKVQPEPGEAPASDERWSRQLSADRFPLLAGSTALTTPYPHPRQVIDAILTGRPHPVRALWTDCNPLVGLEDSWTTLAALQKLDLLVVADITESPTARLADYVLPITTHLESDAITEYSGLNLVAARARAVQPQGEAREEGEIVLDLLARMGYSNGHSAKTYRELLDYRLEPIGMTFEELKRVRYVIEPDSPLKHEDGKLRVDGKPGFNTPSTKIEFTSRTLGEYGYDPLPDFVEPPISPYSTPDWSAEYPLVLISGTRSLEYYSTLGIELDRLRKRRPLPTVEMAPETARRCGVGDGDWALIEAPTTDRAIRRRVALLEGLHPHVVNAEGLWYMPGSEDLVEGVLSVGANVLTPLRDDVDPVVGGSIARCGLCRIRKLEDADLDRIAASRWRETSRAAAPTASTRSPTT